MNDTDNENSAKIPKFNGDQLISSERIDLSSIISLLKTQNEILIIRNRREETLWRQLSDKDNQLNNLNRQRQNEQQKQQFEFEKQQQQQDDKFNEKILKFDDDDDDDDNDNDDQTYFSLA